MAVAPTIFVSDHASGNYQCMSRFVRRVWLCDIDPCTPIDYSHRKARIDQRLHQVAAGFSIGIYSDVMGFIGAHDCFVMTGAGN